MEGLLARERKKGLSKIGWRDWKVGAWRVGVWRVGVWRVGVCQVGAGGVYHCSVVP